MKKILILIFPLTLFFACKVVQVPNYVSTADLIKLKTGSTKQQVLADLSQTYPYDILAGWSDGCEVHHYKYKIPQKLVPSSVQNSSEYLNNGIRQYVKEADVYLEYRMGKLVSVLTNVGKKDIENLLADATKVQNTCAEKGLYGSKNPNSLNYNPDALIDDGSAEFCDCGFIKNENYDPKRPVSDCNQKCIKVKNAANDLPKAENDKKGCTNCDIIDKIISSGKGNVIINFDVNGGGNNEGNDNVNNKKTTINIDKVATPKKEEKEEKPIKIKKVIPERPDSENPAIFKSQP